eukprot:COSAG01_NODE_6375_length_3705_cov_2.301442_1_plen_132_part_00
MVVVLGDCHASASAALLLLSNSECVGPRAAPPPRVCVCGSACYSRLTNGAQRVHLRVLTRVAYGVCVCLNLSLGPKYPTTTLDFAYKSSFSLNHYPTSPGWTGLADRPPICWIRCMQAASSASVIPYRPGL